MPSSGGITNSVNEMSNTIKNWAANLANVSADEVADAVADGIESGIESGTKKIGKQKIKIKAEPEFEWDEPAVQKEVQRLEDKMSSFLERVNDETKKVTGDQVREFASAYTQIEKLTEKFGKKISKKYSKMMKDLSDPIIGKTIVGLDSSLAVKNARNNADTNWKRTLNTLESNRKLAQKELNAPLSYTDALKRNVTTDNKTEARRQLEDAYNEYQKYFGKGGSEFEKSVIDMSDAGRLAGISYAKALTEAYRQECKGIGKYIIDELKNETDAIKADPINIRAKSETLGSIHNYASQRVIREEQAKGLRDAFNSLPEKQKNSVKAYMSELHEMQKEGYDETQALLQALELLANINDIKNKFPDLKDTFIPHNKASNAMLGILTGMPTNTQDEINAAFRSLAPEQFDEAIRKSSEEAQAELDKQKNAFNEKWSEFASAMLGENAFEDMDNKAKGRIMSAFGKIVKSNDPLEGLKEVNRRFQGGELYDKTYKPKYVDDYIQWLRNQFPKAGENDEYIKKSDKEIYASAMQLAKDRTNIFKNMAQMEIDLANQVSGETKKIYGTMANDTYKIFTDGANEWKIGEKIEETDKLIKSLSDQLSNEKDPKLISSLNQQLDNAKIKFLALEDVFSDVAKNIKTNGVSLEFGIIDEYWNAQRKILSINDDTGISHNYDIGVMDEEHFNRITQNIHNEKDLTDAIEQRRQKLIELTKAYDAQDEEARRLYTIYDDLRSQGKPYRKEFDEWSRYTDAMDAQDLGGQKNDILNEYNLLLQMHEKWSDSIKNTPKISFDYDDESFNRISDEIDNILKIDQTSSEIAQTEDEVIESNNREIKSYKELEAVIKELEDIYGKFQRAKHPEQFTDYVDNLARYSPIDHSDYNSVAATETNLNKLKNKILETYKTYKNVQSAIKNNNGYYKGEQYSERDLDYIIQDFKAYSQTYYELSKEFNLMQDKVSSEFSDGSRFEHAEDIDSFTSKMTKDFKGYISEVKENSDTVEKNNLLYRQEKSELYEANKPLQERYNILRDLVLLAAKNKGIDRDSIGNIIPYVDATDDYADMPEFNQPWFGNLRDQTIDVLKEVASILGFDVPQAAERSEVAHENASQAANRHAEAEREYTEARQEANRAEENIPETPQITPDTTPQNTDNLRENTEELEKNSEERRKNMSLMEKYLAEFGDIDAYYRKQHQESTQPSYDVTQALNKVVNQTHHIRPDNPETGEPQSFSTIDINYDKLLKEIIASDKEILDLEYKITHASDAEADPLRENLQIVKNRLDVYERLHAFMVSNPEFEVDDGQTRVLQAQRDEARTIIENRLKARDAAAAQKDMDAERLELQNFILENDKKIIKYERKLGDSSWDRETNQPLINRIKLMTTINKLYEDEYNASASSAEKQNLTKLRVDQASSMRSDYEIEDAQKKAKQKKAIADAQRKAQQAKDEAQRKQDEADRQAAYKYAQDVDREERKREAIYQSERQKAQQKDASDRERLKQAAIAEATNERAKALDELLKIQSKLNSETGTTETSKNNIANLKESRDHYKEINKENKDILINLGQQETVEKQNLDIQEKFTAQLKEQKAARIDAANAAKATAEKEIAKAESQSKTTKNEKIAQSYKELKASVKEYFDLLEKQGSNSLTNKENSRLSELEQKWQNATNEVKEYVAVIGGSAKSVNAVYSARESWLKEVDAESKRRMSPVLGYEKQLIDWENSGKYSSDLIERMQKLRAEIKEINSNPLNFTDPSNLSRLKVAQQTFEKIKSDTKNADFKLAQIDTISKLNTQIEEYISRNSAMGMRFKSQFEKLKLDFDAAPTLKQTKEVVAKFAELKQQVTIAGKTGASFFDTLKQRLIGVNAQLVAQLLSWHDLIRYIRTTAGVVIELDTAMTELRKVSEASEGRLVKSFETSTNTAKELGSTITEVINKTSDWSRLGYEIGDAENLAKVTTLFQTVGDNMTSEDASSYIISSLQGFQMGADQAMEIVDKYNEVANNFAIDTRGIGEALQRSAASFNAANTDLSKSIALVTATK